MDLTNHIAKKIQVISKYRSTSDIGEALRHIKVAESHFSKAVEDGNEELFNDVVYRTNQAFEGMLKVSYTILTGDDSSTLSPSSIENYFVHHNIFTPRVSSLFKKL